MSPSTQVAIAITVNVAIISGLAAAIVRKARERK